MKEGFLKIRQKGSHCFYRHPDGRSTIIPVHVKGMKVGFLRGIIVDMKLERKEFLFRYSKYFK